MACFHPIPAWQLSDGKVVFAERSGSDIVRELELPCGRCVGCRLERSRQWTVRVMHEASLHWNNCFVTLTYREDNLPPGASLDYGDFQLFMKRLRKFAAPVKPRFYMCGEYGEEFLRPHFHACIFGFDFVDRVPWKRGDSGSVSYRSAQLERLWPHGFSSVGDLTRESAGYTARYVMKKMTGDLAEQHYRWVDPDTGEVFDRTPEFNRMSLKPGIGASWLEKYASDVYPSDEVIVAGRSTKPPRYYDKRLSVVDPDTFEDLQFSRFLESRKGVADNTRERRLVREQVTRARIQSFKRSIG